MIKTARRKIRMDKVIPSRFAYQNSSHLPRLPTRTSTPTRTPTRTPTPTSTRRPTATPLYTRVNVYFLSKFRYDNNLPPFDMAGVRWAHSDRVISTVLDEYFKGPGSTEKYSYGWIALYNGFTGYSKLEIVDGMANICLTGSCVGDGRDFNIADLIDLNLKQYPEVQFVKIYDQNGQIARPQRSQ